jgi:hypothetical protein
MTARARCAVCGHGRWLHRLRREPFYETSPLNDYLDSVDRLAATLARNPRVTFPTPPTFHLSVDVRDRGVDG